jgi:hypothetical protein
MPILKLKGLAEAFTDPMADLKRKPRRRVYVCEASWKVEYDQFYPRESKPIIDDTKYRLGQGAEQEDQ